MSAEIPLDRMSVDDLLKEFAKSKSSLREAARYDGEDTYIEIAPLGLKDRKRSIGYDTIGKKICIFDGGGVLRLPATPENIQKAWSFYQYRGVSMITSLRHMNQALRNYM